MMDSFFRKPNHIQFLTIDQDWISKPNHISSETGPMSDFKTSFVQDLISNSVSSILPVPQNGLVFFFASLYCISHVRIIHPRILHHSNEGITKVIPWPSLVVHWYSILHSLPPLPSPVNTLFLPSSPISTTHHTHLNSLASLPPLGYGATPTTSRVLDNRICL